MIYALNPKNCTNYTNYRMQKIRLKKNKIKKINIYIYIYMKKNLTKILNF
jgi:hypothetical protein